MNAVVRIASVLMFVWCACVQAVAEPPRTFDDASWQTLLDGRKGQPVIVHFWGFSCGNCMVELGDWGKFAAAHADTTIAFVNWDRRGADPKRIEKALAKSGLGNVQSFSLANGYEEKLRFAVDHDWMGELPYTRLIARDGTVTTFSGAADFKSLSQWLGDAQQSQR